MGRLLDVVIHLFLGLDTHAHVCVRAHTTHTHTLKIWIVQVTGLRAGRPLGHPI